MTPHEKIIGSLVKSLLDEVVDAPDPSQERANDVLTNRRQQPMTISILGDTKIGKVLTKMVKACRQHRQTSVEIEESDTAISTSEGLLVDFKEAPDKETKQSASKKKATDTVVS